MRWQQTKLLINYNGLETSSADYVEAFTKIILESAKDTIPKTSSVSKRVPVPWWTPEIKNAICQRRKALSRFKQYPTTYNLIIFKKFRARARLLIKLSKKASWETFVNSISISTPLSTLFNKINKISGISRFQQSIILIENNKGITNGFDIANYLAINFQKNTSSLNYSEKFRRIHNHNEVIDLLDINHNPNAVYNHLISIKELEVALTCCKGTSPGPDDICYDMI